MFEEQKPEIKLGRAERRRLEQGKGFKRLARGSNRFVNQNALINAMFSAPTGTAFTFEFIKCRLAFTALCDGTGTQEDWDLIAVTFSVANMRAKHIGQVAVIEINYAIDAMKAAKERKSRHGKYGFSGLEIQQVRASLDLCEEIIAASSQHQLNQATEDYKAKLRADKAKYDKVGRRKLSNR